MNTQGKDNNTSERAYSYHTFIYTFTYSTDEYQKIEVENVDDPFWEKIKEVDDLLKGDEEDEEEWAAYNSLCYFTPKARNAIFNTNNHNTSVSYKYKIPEGIIMKYVIESHQEDKISLFIREMKLTLFPKIKVGILSINLENYDDAREKDKFSGIRRAAQINDWGRRLFFPNRSEKGDDQKNSYIETKGIGIYAENEQGETEELFYTDFEQQYQKNKEKENRTVIKPQLIDALLGPTIKNEFHIADFQSVFDDRMFICSLIRDDFVSTEIKTYNQKIGDYVCYLPGQMFPNTDIEISSLLYGYVFIDSKLHECSCQNRNFRKELLKKHIYDRWIDYGTLYGFTEYAMTCIIDESDDSYHIVKGTFLTQYVELVKLCLMQRAAINVIETDIVNSCNMIHPEQNESIDIEKISEIWKINVIFQNELYLPEVTFQEQGVEIYNILKKSLKIEELNEEIGTKLNNLHELAALLENKRKEKNELKTVKAMNFFSILLGLVAIGDIWGFVDSLFVAYDTDQRGPYFTINCLSAADIRVIEIGVIAIFVLVCISFIIFCNWDRNKKGKRTKWRIMNCGWMKAVTSKMREKKGKKS